MPGSVASGTRCSIQHTVLQTLSILERRRQISVKRATSGQFISHIFSPEYDVIFNTTGHWVLCGLFLLLVCPTPQSPQI